MYSTFIKIKSHKVNDMQKQSSEMFLRNFVFQITKNLLEDTCKEIGGLQLNFRKDPIMMSVYSYLCRC